MEEVEEMIECIEEVVETEEEVDCVEDLEER